MTQKRDYLFVYGTLRSDSGHWMLPLLKPHVSLTGAATVRGRLYVVDDCSALVPDEKAPGVVQGEVCELDGSSVDGTLEALDNYEELGPRHPEPQDYRRERVHATLSDGRTVEAWAYVLNRSTDGLERIESGDFVEWCATARPSSSGA